MIISNALAGDQADEITAALDGGAGAARAKIYDENGAGVPADLSVAITTQTLLVDIPLNDPSFAGFVPGTGTADIVLDVTPEPEATAVATAGATPTLFCRLTDSNGLAHVQLTEAELGLNSDSIATGNLVRILGVSAISIPEQ